VMSSSLCLVLPEDKELREKIIKEFWKEKIRRLRKYFNYSKKDEEKEKEAFFETIRWSEKHGEYEIYFKVYSNIYDFFDELKIGDVFFECGEEGVHGYVLGKTSDKKVLLDLLERTARKMLGSEDDGDVATGKTMYCQHILLVEFAIKYNLPLRY